MPPKKLIMAAPIANRLSYLMVEISKPPAVEIQKVGNDRM
jgi:hypothetical protein